MYAIGGNETSAKLMGLPVGRTKVLVYGFNGLCSVLAGVAYALYVKSGWNPPSRRSPCGLAPCLWFLQLARLLPPAPHGPGHGTLGWRHCGLQSRIRRATWEV